MKGYFVTSTGTDAGKTVFSRALAWTARRAGRRVAALKPIETGYLERVRSDAAALERTSSIPALADAEGLYRSDRPLAPAAVAMEGGPSAPNPAELAAACHKAALDADFMLVEGAGGLLVPLDDDHTVADLARALQLPLLLVAPNQLGVLSHVLTAVESAERRELTLAAVVLTDTEAAPDDVSPRTNRAVLQRWLSCPVHTFPRVPLDDTGLADAAAELDWLRSLCD